MELKEYFEIIKKHKKLFLTSFVLFVLGVFSYFYFRPISYSTSIVLNVTRIGVQQSEDYRYDDFYRLQADEKFCETIVEWLKSPQIVEDIYNEAQIDTSKYTLKQLAGVIKAEKRSSQIVGINFSAPDKKVSKKIADAVGKIISQNTEILNINQKESTWFQILTGDPVIKQNKINYSIVLATFLMGIFLAFWVVMIKHYTE